MNPEGHKVEIIIAVLCPQDRAALNESMQAMKQESFLLRFRRREVSDG